MPACNRPAMRANVSRETSTRTGSAPYSAQCMTNRRPSSDFFLVSPVQTPISRTIPKKSEKVVDSMGQYRHNNFCCFDVRRYLSWIEGLTTNQYVGGSNPSGCTISRLRFCEVFFYPLFAPKAFQNKHIKKSASQTVCFYYF